MTCWPLFFTELTTNLHFFFHQPMKTRSLLTFAFYTLIWPVKALIQLRPELLLLLPCPHLSLPPGVTSRRRCCFIYGATLQISRLCFRFINDLQLRVHTRRPQLISPTCCVTAAGWLPAAGRATWVCIHLLKVWIHQPVCITQSPACCRRCRSPVFVEKTPTQRRGRETGLGYFIMLGTTYISCGGPQITRTDSTTAFNYFAYK